MMLALTVQAPLTAQAEMVRLEVGSDRYGHGWLFADTDGVCAVATAAHVIEDAAGHLLTPTVVTRGDRHLASADPIKPDPEMDIAFLRVLAPGDGDGCTLSRLGPDDLSPMLARTRSAVIDTSEDFQMVTMPVAIRERSIEERSGEYFTVVPVNPDDVIKSGVSGSPVIADGIALGLVLHANGLVVRFDVAKALYRKLRAAIPTSLSLPADSVRLSLETGSADLTSDTVSALLAGDADLPVQGKDGVLRLLLRLPDDSKLAGTSVDIAAIDGADAVNLIVETAHNANGAPGRFTFVRSCRSVTLPGAIDCPLAPRTASFLRLTLIAGKTATLVLRGIALR